MPGIRSTLTFGVALQRQLFIFILNCRKTGHHFIEQNTKISLKEGRIQIVKNFRSITVRGNKLLVNFISFSNEGMFL